MAENQARQKVERHRAADIPPMVLSRVNRALGRRHLRIYGGGERNERADGERREEGHTVR